MMQIMIIIFFSYTTTTCYNFVNDYAILNYLEYPIIIAQEYILIFLVLKYKNILNSRSYWLTALYFGITLGFLSKVIPPPALTFVIVSYFIIYNK
jgi:hypothetical protein